MLFNSIPFVVFFILTIIIFSLIPTRLRLYFLLIASYFFYIYWDASLIYLLILATLINYFGAIKIFESNKLVNKKTWLIITIILTLSLLFIYKYLSFFSQITNSISIIICGRDYFPEFSILLPIGISFYTLQSIGYSIDVYRNDTKPERNLLKFALFVSFFPQLLAGPIERAKNLIPQLNFSNPLYSSSIILGLNRILWGFFKKLVIADQVAPIVNQIYGAPDQFNGIILLIATYLYAIQIYCDFSGYVDIALGTAKLMGVNLTENFNFPYKSQNIREFWNRWHITLSHWFRDYLYIPLGGNRMTRIRWSLNIIIVFVISGFWHGANWTFLFWGLLHGIYFLLYYFMQKGIRLLPYLKSLPSIPRVIKIFTVFHLVLFAWIFFRAESIQDGFTIVHSIFYNIITTQDLSMHLQSIQSFSKNYGAIFWINIIFVLMFIIIDNSKFLKKFLLEEKERVIISEVIFADFLLIFLILFSAEGGQQFIYFQF